MARLGAALLALLACMAAPRASFAGFFVYELEWTEDVSIGSVATSAPVPAVMTGGAVEGSVFVGGFHRPSELTFQISVPQATPVSTVVTGDTLMVLHVHALEAAQVGFQVTPYGVSVDGGVPGRQLLAVVDAGGGTTPLLSIPLNIGAGTTHMFVTEPFPGFTIPVTVWNYGWTQYPVNVTGLSNSPYLGGDGTRIFPVPWPVITLEGGNTSTSSLAVSGLVVAPTKIHLGGAAPPTTYVTFSSIRFIATFPLSVPEPGPALLLLAGAGAIAYAARRARPR